MLQALKFSNKYSLNILSKVPHRPCYCKLWYKALNLQVLSGSLFQSKSMHSAVERHVHFTKWSNKHVKAIQRGENKKRKKKKCGETVIELHQICRVTYSVTIIVLIYQLCTRLSPRMKRSPSWQSIFKKLPHSCPLTPLVWEIKWNRLVSIAGWPDSPWSMAAASK